MADHKWHTDPENPHTKYFEIGDWFYTLTYDTHEGDTINGVPLDEIEIALNNLLILLYALDIVVHIDFEGEPAIWLKKRN